MAYAVVYLAVLVFLYRGAKSAQTGRRAQNPDRVPYRCGLLRPLLSAESSIIEKKPYSATEQIALMVDSSKSMTIRDEDGNKSRFQKMRNS